MGLFLADRLITANARFVKFINNDPNKFGVDFRLS